MDIKRQQTYGQYKKERHRRRYKEINIEKVIKRKRKTQKKVEENIEKKERKDGQKE